MKVDLLRKVSLFEGLNEEEVETLADVTQIRKFPKNCMVILADEQGDSFFVIDSGKAKVSVTAADGREVILSVLGPGEFFGDMSLLDDHPRSANVTTLEVSDLLVIRRSDFLDAIQSHPSIAIKLMVTLAHRLRSADRQTANFALLGITDRICNVLLSVAEEQGVETEDGIIIEKRPTHQVLASMAGTARETITRVLNRLESEGYIRSQGRKLVIMKRTRE